VSILEIKSIFQRNIKYFRCPFLFSPINIYHAIRLSNFSLPGSFITTEKVVWTSQESQLLASLHAAWKFDSAPDSHNDNHTQPQFVNYLLQTFASTITRSLLGALCENYDVGVNLTEPHNSSAAEPCNSYPSWQASAAAAARPQPLLATQMQTLCLCLGLGVANERRL
jgi:hypothetical protein